MRIVPYCSIVLCVLLASLWTIDAIAQGQTLNAKFCNLKECHGHDPATAAIGGPAKIKCTKATTDFYGNPKQGPGCVISAPGVALQIKPGETVGASGAGTVVLTCWGTGNRLTCSAEVN
jgi:hypothetical protein